ncbi:sulfurtransferase complex subunit TusC [Litchfieldella rifensis]|uniref:Sulfurtransferase complex subunit TusC n=1 Tax=Litchfieldella rifensis TaxID=762643 RepID=A0ABV7LSK4_9GAMM
MNDIPEGDLLVILRHGPHGSSWLREGLEAALVAAAFGQRVSLLFLGDGAMALLDGQQVGPLGQKGTQPMLEMLGMYDIDTLLVDDRALAERGIDVDDLSVPVSRLEGGTIAGVLARHRQILNF